MGDKVPHAVLEKPKPSSQLHPKHKSKSHHSHEVHPDQPDQTQTPIPIPQQIPLFPPVSPGLEFLINTNGLIIEQQIEWGEVMLGVNFNNRYHIVDYERRRLYFAAENSDAVNIYFMGRCRPWNIIVLDLAGNAVMQGRRSSSCCFYGLCDNSVIVTSAEGLVLGSISQNTTCCNASFNIHDSDGNIVLLLDGPQCSILCPSGATCFEAEFPIVTVQGEDEIGRITKKFSGFVREMRTQADTFCVDYPPDLHVNIKAVLIYGAFMIDFIYYENESIQSRGGGRRRRHRRHRLRTTY
ncbi:unnamed protein product [Orchesella dallaii]|uniref:Phospholipid scramblase n=1 Tax=Orchesella dallaii TaxID=48710 RepID=A0ABP1QIR0_9HEXA